MLRIVSVLKAGISQDPRHKTYLPLQTEVYYSFYFFYLYLKNKYSVANNQQPPKVIQLLNGEEKERESCPRLLTNVLNALLKSTQMLSWCYRNLKRIVYADFTCCFFFLKKKKQLENPIAHYSRLSRPLWAAAQPSAILAPPSSFVLSANLLIEGIR